MNELVSVAAVSALREFRPLLVEHGGIPYTILLKNDRINAFINICPHQDKIFKPRLKANCLICPFHDVAFDCESGDVTDSNGKTVRRGLPKVEVLVRNEWVYLVVTEQHRSLLQRAWAASQARAARKSRWSWTRFFGLGGKKNGSR